MASPAELVPPPTAEFLQTHFPLSGVEIGAGFGKGRHGRRVYTVHAREGTFAAKVNDKPPALGHATRELDVLPYLQARDYPHAPALVPTRDGAPLVHTSTRSVTLLEYVPGHFDPDGPQDAPTWAALARAIAALSAFCDYPHPFAQQYIDEVPNELREKVRGLPLEAEFVALLDRIEPLRRCEQRSFVHGEVNFANSGARADGTVVLLDWDSTGTGPTPLDYGYPLITQFIDQFDLTFNRAATEAFYGAYTDAGGLVDVEDAFLAALFQAMFLMWFFNVDGRWARIQWAVRHEDELCAVIERACRR